MSDDREHSLTDLPSALTSLDDVLAPLRKRRAAVFMDFDGTLSPIVERPEDAHLLPGLRPILRDLTRRAPVAVVSGRDALDVRRRVGLPRIACAGSHGFEVLGPGDRRHVQEGAEEFLPHLDRAERELRRALGGIDGCQVERKRFAVAVHFRRVADDQVPKVEKAVKEVARRQERLRLTGGKKIHELRPDLDWDKGRAVRRLLRDLAPEGAVPIYLGDDVTDEDAFTAIGNEGITIAVGNRPRPTRARWALADPEEVARFLKKLADHLGPGAEPESPPDPWKLVYEDYDPDQERLREALCTLGNGRFATRGAAPEVRAGEHHYPGTYLGGLYDRLTSEVAGKQVTNEDLVNLPSWLALTFRPEGGDWFHVDQVELLAFRQELDLRLGVLKRELRCRDDQGRVTHVVQRRLVHMGQPQLAALETEITPENWEGRLEVRSALEGRVGNDGVERYGNLRGDHLVPLQAGRHDPETTFLKIRTKQSNVQVALAARTRVHRRGETADLALGRRIREEDAYVAEELDLELARGETAVVEKVVSLRSSRDPAVSECDQEARRDLAWAGDFEQLYESHAVTWDQLWQRFRLHTDAGGPIEQILNLHTFHLLQTVSHNSIGLDMGVPARGWHGEAYRGHIFWDELFIFPFLNLRLPELTRSLLMYRWRRLPEARRNARENGHEGALYPWQSGSDGREESQRVHLNPRSGNWLPDPTRLQHHIDAAVAYNVWQHYQATGDLEFLSAYGAEMILETARFWASSATWCQEHERYELLGVMGPDEYHSSYRDRQEPGLDNNAYTNVMAVWNLMRARDVLDLLPQRRVAELREKLGIADEELELWDRVSRRMRICFHGDGIISQFEGYGDLEEFDWDGYRKKYDDIQRLDRILEAEGDTPNNYQASKQADVLMLFYLLSAEELRSIFERLGYELDPATVRRTVDYYLARTSHGSTLSGVVHGWVLARSDRARSWEFFERALRSDVTDIQGGTTPEGIHLGAMAGTIDLVQRCYSGIELREDVLRFNPVLPEGLRRLRFTIHYRQAREIEVDISHERLRLKAVPSGHLPIKIHVAGREWELAAGQEREFPLERPGGRGGAGGQPAEPTG